MKLTTIEKAELVRYIGYLDIIDSIREKTFFITGCNGMTGSGIIKWLLLENELHNAGVSIIASTRYPEVMPDYVEPSDSISFCRFGCEDSFVQGKHVDYIIHAAAPTGREFFVNHPFETISVILSGTEKMINIAKLNPGCRMLFLSSLEVYGLPDEAEPVKESYIGAIDSLNIRNSYPLGKKAAEFLCYSATKEYDVPIMIARPSAIQGLFQPYSVQRVFNELLRCIIEGKNLVMKSDGMSKKSFVYTLDAISAMFLILFKGNGGEAYNITDPATFMTVKDLTERLFSRFNDKLYIEYDIQDTSKTGYLAHLSFTQNIDKIKALGWVPRTSLEKMYEIDIERFTNNQ